MSATYAAFPSGKIVLSARIEGKDEASTNELVELLLDVKRAAEANPEVVAYRLTLFGNKIFLFEEYNGQKAIEGHLQTQAFKTLYVKVPDLVTTLPTFEYFQEITL